MDECEYGKYCMCSTCFYQINNSGRECCTTCVDCAREGKQVHDVWSCTKYMRKEYLRNAELLSNAR